MADWAQLPVRYQVAEDHGGLLGVGVFGQVRPYTDTQTGEAVAIKRMDNIVLSKIKKILREIRIQAFFTATESPHIVPIVDLHVFRNPPAAAPAAAAPAAPPPRRQEVDSGLTAFIVLPRAVCSLDVLISYWAAPHLATPAHWPKALRDAVARRDPRLPPLVMAQVLMGLHIFHSAGVMHRDLKPANILIFAVAPQAAASRWHARAARVCSDPAGFGVVAAVADYGWARSAADAAGVTPFHVAPPSYRAPELVVDGRRYGWGVDMWAVGAIAAEWFRPPETAALRAPPDAHLFPLPGNAAPADVLYRILERAPLPSFEDLLRWLARLPATAADSEAHLARRRRVLGMFWLASRVAEDTLAHYRTAIEEIAAELAKAPEPAAGHGRVAPPAAREVLRQMRVTHTRQLTALQHQHRDQLENPEFPGDTVTEAEVEPFPGFSPADVTFAPHAPALHSTLGVLGGAPEDAIIFVSHCLRIPPPQRPNAFQAMGFPWIANAMRPPPPPGGGGGADPAGIEEAGYAVGSLAGGARYLDEYDTVATAEEIWEAAGRGLTDAFAIASTAHFKNVLEALGDAFAAWVPTRQPVGALPADLFGVLPVPPAEPPALAPAEMPREAVMTGGEDEFAMVAIPDAEPSDLPRAPLTFGK